MDWNAVCMGIILTGGVGIIFAFMFMSIVLLVGGLLFALIGLGSLSEN